MSMDDQGMSRLNCVWRWQSGFCSLLSPPIHIFAGLKVCIHAMRPMQFGAASASRRTAEISSRVVSTGLKTTRIGSVPDRLRPSTIASESDFTWSSVSGP